MVSPRTVSVQFKQAAPVFVPAPTVAPGSLLLPAVLLAAPLAYGAYRAFPLYDDGWLALLLKEHGAGIVTSTMPDRPLYALLMKALLFAGSGQKAVLVAFTLSLWIALAYASGLLWARIHPELARYAPAVASLVIAPIVATCQMTTIVTSLQILPPLLLSLATLLLWKYREEGGTSRLAGAFCLAVSGALFSEYGIPAAAASTVLLLPEAIFPVEPLARKRSRQAVLALVGAAVLGYGVFLAMSDIRYRPSVNPALASATVARNPVAPVLNVLNGTWRAMLGAYASAFGQISAFWDSKSTLAAVAFAMLSALCVLWACRSKSGPGRDVRIGAMDIGSAILAIMVGLAPVAVMGRSTHLMGFGSRFLIPILPVAAIATMCILLRIFRADSRWLAIGALGFLCGDATVLSVNSILHEHALMTKIGQAMRPYVAAHPENTVAVVNRRGMDYEFTAKAAAAWSAGESTRFWLLDADKGARELGPRDACHQPLTFTEIQREVKREGPLAQALWVETHDFNIATIEPYCTTKVLAHP
jgi:hypothetical protein